MSDPESGRSDPSRLLRERAEALLAGRDAGVTSPTPDLEALVHDLAVHQIELQLQNEELREAQLLVEKARDEFARLYNQAPVGYMSLDANGMVRKANHTLVGMLGEGHGPLLDSAFADHLTEADRAVFNARYRAFFNAPDQKMVEVRVRQDGGGNFLARLTGRREHDLRASRTAGAHAEEPRAEEPLLLVVVQDVTELRRVTAALDAEKELLSVTLRSLGEAVIATDIEGRVTLVNEAAEALIGERLAEAQGQPLTGLLRLPDLVTEVLESGQLTGRKATRLTLSDGTEHTLTPSGAPIRDHDGRLVGVVLVLRDTTAEAQLQQELQRIAKLDSLGVMAAGIAHDFNNILTAIAGNVGLAHADTTARPETRAHLADAEKATMRARDLTRQLLTFATGGAPVREVVAVPPLVHEAVNLALTGSRSRCQVLVPDTAWAVHADPGQLHQVLHNLLLNAAESMVGGGAIVLTVSNVRLGLDAAEPLPPGDYVRIDVVDQGRGISPEIRDRIFDPFFSTKQGGIGLGLASAYSIVRNHHGYIDVESVPGRGSRFSVFLPASAKAWSKPPSAVAVKDAKPWRILVLDDEPMIASVTRRILSAKGHEVVTVADGTEAIARWVQQRDAGQPFDLAILDLTIPGGLGGKAVAAELRARDPSARTVASSGYSNDPIMADHQTHGFTACLPKPYTVDDLHRLIGELQGRR